MYIYVLLPEAGSTMAPNVCCQCFCSLQWCVAIASNVKGHSGFCRLRLGAVVARHMPNTNFHGNGALYFVDTLWPRTALWLVPECFQLGDRCYRSGYGNCNLGNEHTSPVPGGLRKRGGPWSGRRAPLPKDHGRLLGVCLHTKASMPSCCLTYVDRMLT